MWRFRIVARPAPRQREAQVRIIAERDELGRHLGFVARDEKVLARSEEMLGVAPWRGDERQAAGECLEDADRRDARQQGCVVAARHVHRREMPGEQLRRKSVGSPTLIAGAVGGQQGLRRFGIADAMDVEWQPRLRCRLQQEGFDLLGSLTVAPVSDPDQPRAGLLLRKRMEQASVGRLVPGPHAVAPTPSPVDLRQRLAESQDAIVAGQIERAHRLRFADCAMMRVVEQQSETVLPPAEARRRAATKAGSFHSWTITSSASPTSVATSSPPS